MYKIYCIFHFCRDLQNVEIYKLFKKNLCGENPALRNLRIFLQLRKKEIFSTHKSNCCKAWTNQAMFWYIQIFDMTQLQIESGGVVCGAS